MTPTASAARTAMARTDLSRPVQQALDDQVIEPGSNVFDFGCGRGGDVRRLNDLGIAASGWDPAHQPEAARLDADVVNIGYVVNVIADPLERREALRQAWALARRTLIVSARPDWELRDLRSANPKGDGWITSAGTFQKFFGQEELRLWIDQTLEEQSIAAAPGIFYVFRRSEDVQSFRARRVRRVATPRLRVSEVLFEAHRHLLDELVAFLEERGRLPVATELPSGAELVKHFGSIKSAFLVVRRVTGDDRWEVSRAMAEQNLLVFLALAAFGGRSKLSDLPDDLQRDVRAFFGSYKMAVTEADRLLFAVGRQEELDSAVRASTVGKVLPDAFYVHTSALGAIPSVLRVYEGCSRALVGNVPDATLVKLGRVERKVSYMSYPTFDRDAHPALSWSLRADLRRFDVKFTDFSESTNPPVLHRKETFVSLDYDGRDKFAKLTQQEERAGLLGGPGIGNRAGWEELLDIEGFALRGHRLVKGQGRHDPSDRRKT